MLITASHICGSDHLSSRRISSYRFPFTPGFWLLGDVYHSSRPLRESAEGNSGAEFAHCTPELRSSGVQAEGGTDELL